MWLFLLGILPAMALLTWVSGGTALMRARPRRLGEGRVGAGCTLAVILGLIGLAAMQEGVGLLVTLVFSLHALGRGLWLVHCAVRAARPPEVRPEWLAGASPARLLPAGLLVSAAAIAAGGAAVAFVGYWPFEDWAARDLRRAVAIVIAKGRLAAGPDGAPRYPEPITRSADGGWAIGDERVQLYQLKKQSFGAFGYFDLEGSRGPEGRSFVIRATPERYPFPPYHLLVSLPAFYADESGKVRAIECRGAGRPCPSDAPVAFEVGEDEVEEALRRLRGEPPAEGKDPEAARLERLWEEDREVQAAREAAATTPAAAPDAPEAAAPPTPGATR
jgi:hypothetical protein